MRVNGFRYSLELLTIRIKKLLREVGNSVTFAAQLCKI